MKVELLNDNLVPNSNNYKPQKDNNSDTLRVNNYEISEIEKEILKRKRMSQDAQEKRSENNEITNNIQFDTQNNSIQQFANEIYCQIVFENQVRELQRNCRDLSV